MLCKLLIAWVVNCVFSALFRFLPCCGAVFPGKCYNLHPNVFYRPVGFVSDACRFLVMTSNPRAVACFFSVKVWMCVRFLCRIDQ